jgi:hypothetical protein
MGSEADAYFCFGFGGDSGVVAVGVRKAFIIVLDDESDAAEGKGDCTHLGLADEFTGGVRVTFDGNEGVTVCGCGLVEIEVVTCR